MAQQLRDLLTSFNDLSDDDAIEKIRTIRKNRNTVKPSTQVRKKKETKKKTSKLVDALKTMSDEERMALIASLEGESNE